MQGRLENKIRVENLIQQKLAQMPDYMGKFYLSMRSREHTTKNRYITNVSRFLLHYGNGAYPTENILKKITSFDIQSYMTDIQYYYDKNGNIKEMKETTQCIIYASLASFFTFLARANFIDKNPFDNDMIERPRTKENEVVFLTPDEVRTVEHTIMNGAGNELSVAKQKNWKYRDVLLFRIPIVNGLRVTALSEINVEDIDLDNRKIRVVEKGGIEKTVDFDFKTGQYIGMWLSERKRLLKGADCNALFISNRRTRMTTTSIENVIDKYTKCIEGKHITPHKLRSTCGTNVYQETKDIYLVSKVLGHKNTMPTRRYAAVFSSDITNAVNSVASLY